MSLGEKGRSRNVNYYNGWRYKTKKLCKLSFCSMSAQTLNINMVLDNMHDILAALKKHALPVCAPLREADFFFRPRSSPSLESLGFV